MFDPLLNILKVDNSKPPNYYVDFEKEFEKITKKAVYKDGVLEKSSKNSCWQNTEI
jgi:hypothetical protein